MGRWPWRLPAPPPGAARCHHTHRPSPGAAPAATSPKRVGLRQPASLSTCGCWLVAPPRANLRAFRAHSHSQAGGQTQAFLVRFGRQLQRPELQVCTASRRLVLGTQHAFCGWRSFARRGPARARCVNGDLGSLPKRQSIGQHFDSGKSRRKKLVAARAPALQHIHAAARSMGAPCAPSNPAVGQTARWSPNGSSRPPHLHWRGACGNGAHRRLNRSTRIQPGMWNSGAVGRAMMARCPPEPVCNARKKANCRIQVTERALRRHCVQSGRRRAEGRRTCGRAVFAWGGRPPPQPEFPTAG